MLYTLENLKVYPDNMFFLIAGPCVIEDDAITFEIAEKIAQITTDLHIPYIFKASYKKANRTRHDSFSGHDAMAGLELLKQVREQLQIPVLTDIHESVDAEIAAQFVDVLQIPAFLCRQTELLYAAAKTGKIINIKKGQFLSGDSMKYAVSKVKSKNNDRVMVTERGNTFGYNELIVDFRNISIMQKENVPVILDVTHSLQEPNTKNGITGGNPEMIELISKAGIAAGVDGLFIETHPHPEKALSDGANMLPLDQLENLLKKLIKIRKAIIE